MPKTPSAFSIAHYILLFIVSTLCTISVVWVLIAANNREASIHDQITNNNPDDKSCQRATADAITLLWQDNPQDIPPKYLQMESEYANRIVMVRTKGSCNGTKFVCKMGEKRSSCDPCALNSAKKRAMFHHISDAIDKMCKNN